jgi:hypothetical protein
VERSGGKAGRPFGNYSIDELEAQVKKVRELNDLKALRAELGRRKSKRAAELDDLLARLIRTWTGSYKPDAQPPGQSRLGGPQS